MNQNDVNRAFTEKVTELLSRGYQIYHGTMGGSQGVSNQIRQRSP